MNELQKGHGEGSKKYAGVAVVFIKKVGSARVGVAYMNKLYFTGVVDKQSNMQYL